MRRVSGRSLWRCIELPMAAPHPEPVHACSKRLISLSTWCHTRTPLPCSTFNNCGSRPTLGWTAPAPPVNLKITVAPATKCAKAAKRPLVQAPTLNNQTHLFFFVRSAPGSKGSLRGGGLKRSVPVAVVRGCCRWPKRASRAWLAASRTKPSSQGHRKSVAPTAPHTLNTL